MISHRDYSASSYKSLCVALESCTMTFWPCGSPDNRQKKTNESRTCHGPRITDMNGQNGLHINDGTGYEHATLISETYKKPSNRIRRDLREAHGYDAHRSLNQKLHRNRSQNQAHLG